MSHRVKEVFQKVVSTFLSITFILWSVASPLGYLLYPQLVLAAAPVRSGGIPPNTTGTPIDALVDIFFDQAIQPGTASSTSVLLQTNTGNVQGGTPTGTNLCTSYTYDNNNARVVCNHANLTVSTWYTLTVTTAVKNLSNQAVASNIVVQFQTTSFGGGATNSPPPVITGSNPASGSSVPLNVKLRVYFSPGGDTADDTMATTGDGSVLSLTNIQLFLASNGVQTGSNLLACANTSTDCNMFWGSILKELVITPGKKAPGGTDASTGGTALVSGNSYILFIKNTVKNTDGLVLQGPDYIIQFTVGASDSTGPAVLGTFPTDGAIGVDRATYDVGVGFNEGIDPATVTTSTVQLIPDTNGNDTADDARLSDVQVQVAPDGRGVSISPLTLLAASKKHFIKVVSGASGIKDISGNTMAADVIKSFTTGTNVNGAGTDTVKPFVIFADASNFEIEIEYSEPINATDAASSTLFTLESPVGVPVSLTGKVITYEAHEKSTRIKGLNLPPSTPFKVIIATSTRDLAGNGFDASGTPPKNVAQGSVISTSTGGGPGTTTGQVDFFTSGTEPIMVMPDSQIAGATSQYRGEFKAGTSIPDGGKIILTFPSGFSFVADGGTKECQDKLDQFDNNDINGPSAGVITFTLACDSQARTVTLTTSGAATVANDFLHLKLQGIINSTVPKDFTTGGYTVDIKTFNASNSLLESKTSMPFFLATPGTQSISGFVFNDTNKNDTKDLGETGVDAVTVCLGGPMVGFNCVATDSTGAYSFGQLSNGFYNVGIPPITSTAVSVVGGSMFRDVNLTGGLNASGVNFGLKVATETISVTVSGGPASEKVDVGAFNPYNTSQGGFTMRELTLDGAGAGSVSLPATIGKWQVNIMPWMPKTPGAPPPPPEFKFLPPQPKEVSITTANQTVSVTFTLQTTNRTVKGKVIDGSNAGIPNAYVNARPATFTEGGVFGGGFSQTRSDGTFELKVVNGSYIVEAHMPGMPSPEPVQVTVQDNTGASDGNATADVYANGALVGSAGITLKIAKADRSIAGRVLDESGNAIAYAFVNAEKVDPNNTGIFLGHFVGSPTDSSGNYILYVSDGTYKLRAFAPGFGDLGQKTVVVSGSSLSGQNFQASASDFGTVSGTVFEDTNGDGVKQSGENAINGANVFAFGPNGGNGTVSGKDPITGVEGSYSLKVRAGTGYNIEGFIPGKGPLASTGAGNFAVTASATVTRHLTLAGTGTITVTISGVTEAFVDARDSSGRGFGSGSNTSGVYTLTLPASSSGITYTVRAHSPKHGPIGSQSVTLSANGSASVTFSAGTLFTVSGTVSSTAVACKEGVSLFLSDPDNGRHAGGASDVNGAFSIQVPNGTYNLVANKSGCVDNANPAKVVVNGANVSTGTNRTMTAADSSITGRVTLSGSNVITPTFVFADNGSGKYVVDEVDTSATGTNNNYTLSLTAGTWTVKARSDGSESTSVSVTVTAGGTVTQNLTLSAISGYTIREAKPFNIKPSQGGTVKNTDISSNFEVNIPSGALGSSSNDATVSTKEKTSVVDPPTDSIDILGDKAIEVTPTDASGNKITTLAGSSGASATLIIPYSEADIPAGTDESKLLCGVWEDQKQIWEALPTTVDTTNNTLTCSTTHFSDFAPMAPIGGSSAPATPTGFSVGNPGINSLLITWNAVSGATGYNIYRDTSSGGSFPRLGSEPTVNSGTQTSYTDSGLTCNTTYFYRVSAKNAVGESAASSASSATSPCSGGGGGGGGGGTSAPAIQPKAEEKPAVQPLTPEAKAPSVPGTAGLIEGSIIRLANAAKVFVVKAGKLVHIPNPKVFAALGLNWANVKSVSATEVAGVSETTLTRATGDTKVYKLKDGKKIHIPSAQAFAGAGHKWGDIAEVDKKLIENTPDATLIRASNSPRVYKLEKGKLRWIRTATAFKRLKFAWNDVTVVDPKELYYAVGTDIK